MSRTDCVYEDGLGNCRISHCHCHAPNPNIDKMPSCHTIKRISTFYVQSNDGVYRKLEESCKYCSEENECICKSIGTSVFCIHPLYKDGGTPTCFVKR